MKKNKKRSILCAGICVMALAGMSMTSYADTETTEAAEERMMERMEDDGSVTAKIVSADTSSITVYLSQRPEHNGQGDPMQDGDTTPPELPTDADGTVQMPEHTDDMPERPEGEESQGGGRGMMMNFSEETTTLTLTEDTVITKGMEQESVSVSDLAADSIVRIVTDGDTVVSISIMDMEMPAEAE